MDLDFRCELVVGIQGTQKKTPRKTRTLTESTFYLDPWTFGWKTLSKGTLQMGRLIPVVYVGGRQQRRGDNIAQMHNIKACSKYKKKNTNKNGPKGMHAVLPTRTK
jgi:hypothetical protein